MVYILQFIPVDELLTCVSRVNTFFHSLILSNAQLFTDITFSNCFEIDEFVLQVIMSNPKLIKKLQLSFQDITIPRERFNAIISKLQDAKSLTVLELAEMPLSDISFLSYARQTSLVTLDLSSTEIDNRQVQNIKCMKSLQALYVSFTKLSPNVIVQVVQTLDSIEIFDACGILFGIKHIRSLMAYSSLLKHLHVSVPKIEENVIFTYMSTKYPMTVVNIYQ